MAQTGDCDVTLDLDQWLGVEETRDMDERERVVAVGLLTERDLQVLGQGFKRTYRLCEGHDFDDLLRQIDLAERQYIQVRPRQ